MRSYKQQAYKTVRICVILGLFVFLFFQLIPHFHGTHFNKKILIAILCIQPIVLINLFLIALRYDFLLGMPKKQLFRIYCSVLLSFGLSIVLPGRTSELLRPAYLKKHCNISLTKSFPALAIEKILDLTALGIISLLFISSYLFKDIWMLWLTFGLLPTLALVFLPTYQGLVYKLLNILFKNKIKDILTRIVNEINNTAKHGTLIPALLIGLIAWLIGACSIYTYFYIATYHMVSLNTAILIFIFSTIGGAIPLIPGGFGTYEAAVVFVLKSVGFKFGAALTLAIGLHLSQLGITSILGLIVLATHKTGLSSILSLVYKRNEQ